MSVPRRKQRSVAVTAAAVGLLAAASAVVLSEGAVAAPPPLSSSECPGGKVHRGEPTYALGAKAAHVTPEETMRRWAAGSGFSQRHPQVERRLAFDAADRRDYVFEQQGERRAIVTFAYNEDIGWHIEALSECSE